MGNPALSPRKQLYSIDWARSTVKKCLEKYARATEFLLKHSAITINEMVYSLACNDALWPIIRDIIHRTDAMQSGGVSDGTIASAYNQTTTLLLSTEQLKSCDLALQCRIEYLTALRERLRLEEQGFLGTRGPLRHSSRPTSPFTGKPKEKYVK